MIVPNIKTAYFYFELPKRALNPSHCRHLSFFSVVVQVRDSERKEIRSINMKFSKSLAKVQRKASVIIAAHDGSKDIRERGKLRQDWVNASKEGDDLIMEEETSVNEVQSKYARITATPKSIIAKKGRGYRCDDKKTESKMELDKAEMERALRTSKRATKRAFQKNSEINGSVRATSRANDTRMCSQGEEDETGQKEICDLSGALGGSESEDNDGEQATTGSGKRTDSSGGVSSADSEDGDGKQATTGSGKGTDSNGNSSSADSEDDDGKHARTGSGKSTDIDRSSASSSESEADDDSDSNASSSEAEDDDGKEATTGSVGVSSSVSSPKTLKRKPSPLRELISVLKNKTQKRL